MRSLNLYLFGLALLVFTLAQPNSRKLIFVQEVFRHGARFPIYPSSKDLSNLTNIKYLQGQLTRQGQSQHYLLGQKLYQIYWEPLFGKNNNKYRQQKFYFKSTDVHRTIQSLQAQLLGIFERTDILKIDEAEIPYSYPPWNDTFNRSAGDLFEKSPYFHPLPIHMEKGPSTPWTQGDFLRTTSSSFCYTQQSFQAANLRDPYILNITQNINFTKAANAVGQALNQTLGFFDVPLYVDNAICLTFLGLKTLPIFSKNGSFARQLATINVLQGFMKYYYTQKQLRTISTGFFNQTVNHFKRVTENQEGVQMAFYSAHDSSLQNFLARLDLINVKCVYENYLNGTKDSQYCILDYPGFSSQIIFQVYQYPNKTNTFQLRYNGNYRRIPFCDYQFECNIEDFYNWYDSWKDQDWVRSCGIKDSTSETYFSIIIVELGVIIVFAVGTILRYLKSKKPEINEQPKKLTAADPEQPNPTKFLQESLMSEQNQQI